MKIVGSNLYYRMILCLGIVTVAIMLTWFISPQAQGGWRPRSDIRIGGMVTTD
jgi:hypothetical protein